MGAYIRTLELHLSADHSGLIGWDRTRVVNDAKSPEPKLSAVSRPHSVSTSVFPRSPLAELRSVELTAGSEPLLQRFFDDNPLYFLSVNGEPAQPGEAHEEIHGALPAGWPYTKKWVVGYVGANGSLAAMANVVSDLLAPSVWHISTFIVATSRHGAGDAQVLYRSLESWALRSGACWLRLGVVRGNARAERFWEREGFVQTRLRAGVVMGMLTNTLRVMFKPLAGGSMEQYLTLAGRDRPEGDSAV
jgi:GNAT superfamily N-acetyltransferase